MVRALIPKSKYAAATPTLPNFRADESSSSARSTTQRACDSELTPTPRWRDSLRLCSLPVRHRTGDDAGCVQGNPYGRKRSDRFPQGTPTIARPGLRTDRPEPRRCGGTVWPRTSARAVIASPPSRARREHSDRELVHRNDTGRIRLDRLCDPITTDYQVRRSPGTTYNADATSVVATIPSDTQHDDGPRQPRRHRSVQDLRHSPPATTQQVTPPPSPGREITKYGRRLKPTAALAPGEQAPVSQCINPPITNLITEKSAQLVKTRTSPMRPVARIKKAACISASR